MWKIQRRNSRPKRIKAANRALSGTARTVVPMPISTPTRVIAPIVITVSEAENLAII